MKCIEQVDAYIKSLNSKPTKRVEKAAQSIAKKFDDALAKGYEIEWQCRTNEKSQTVSIVDVTQSPRFVCRINDTQEWLQVFNVFDGISDNMNGGQGMKFSTLDTMMQKWYDAEVE